MDFEIVETLRQSAKSTVLLVRDKESGQLFVQKTLQGRHSVYELLESCTHPYLPKLYEVAVKDDSAVIVEEYIEGETLDVTLSEKAILAAMKELCTVLDFLHRKGIVHRDIKPSNLLLAKDGHIRLIDFDAARTVKDEVERDTRLLGTRGYAPPEQYGFAQTDARADVFAIGVTFGQLLGDRAIRRRYQKIIKKCTNLNPEKRYQSAKRVAGALRYPYKKTFAVFFLLLAVIFAGMVLRRLPASEYLQSLYPTEDLLFFAKDSEYIIESVDDIVTLGKSTVMNVDMAGDGAMTEFSITLAPDDSVKLSASVGEAGGAGPWLATPLWKPNSEELLCEIPKIPTAVDADCLLQITCVDADGDGIKELFVSKGNRKDAVVTEVYQYVNLSDETFRGIGTMWGVTTMRLHEPGMIRAEVGAFPNTYKYIYGELLGIDGNDFDIYKEAQSGAISPQELHEIIAGVGRSSSDTSV